MPQILVIAHNLRSAHNVGSLLRTAEGLGVKEVYLTGYTPYPLQPNDERLPHIISKVDKQISKTALGAEKLLGIHSPDLVKLISELKKHDYVIAGLEQTSNSVSLHEYKTPSKIALILGREVEGIESDVLALCDKSIEIPMRGKKESFNVVQAAAMALYHFAYMK